MSRLKKPRLKPRNLTCSAQFQPFDPVIQSSLNLNRYSSPSYSQLQGVSGSANANAQLPEPNRAGWLIPRLSLRAQISRRQSRRTSIRPTIPSITSIRISTSALTFTITQPLLRGAGRFANTALIKIARRSLDQSRSSFEAEVNDAILNVVSQYWNAVAARGALDVQQKSLKLAEASYDRDKRSLELGALPPLDIYRSQSEVAARKVEVIQAAYALTQAEEALRLTIGADRDPQANTLEFNLTEKPQTEGDLENIDAGTALARGAQPAPGTRCRQGCPGQ